MTDSPEDLVRRTAALARLEIDGEEARRLGGQFARILEAFQTLAELDDGGAATATGPTDGAAPRRPDEARPSLPVDAALANAPRRIEDFYGVPKTIGGDG